MNFTPEILTYISVWSAGRDINVDTRIEFVSGKIRLIFSFYEARRAKVWNKAYEAAFLNKCNLTLFELVKETLKEAEKQF